MKSVMLRGLSVLAATTVFAALFWFLIVVPQTEKIPNNFYLYMEQEGEDQIADTVGGALSAPFKLRESLIQKTISSDGNYITISSTISGVNYFTDEEIFHSDEKYEISVYDVTYKNNPQDQFWFKRGVEKHDYQFYHPLVFANTPLIYQRTENIEGLNTYVFRATTTGNNISDSFPQFNGATILSDTTSDFWVEPTTGDLVKFEKHWTDYTMQDQNRIPVQEGWKKTTNYSIFILSEAAKTKIENINYYTKIVPAFLVSLIAGVNLIFILRKQISQINQKLKKIEKLAIVGTISARLAHDLRNPLTVMKAQLGIMTERNNKEPTQDVVRLTNAVNRMNRQIDEIAGFVRERPPRIEKVSSSKLIESTLKNTPIPDKTQVFLPNSDITLYGDFTQLETVLSNIITNSIQAIDGNGTITISVKDESNFVEIAISDSGPGIPQQNMEKIFEPLFTTKNDGTGLGLSSCQTIMENHGGKITVHNNPTTFTLHIPKKESKITLNN